MAKVIVVTSGKGGVGKTTATANIGAGLAMCGKKTALLDTDIGLRNLDVVLGLENRIVYDIVDVAEGVCKPRQALIKDRRYDGLYFMPAAQTRDKNALSPEQMKTLIDELRPQFDYILIDCPAGIEQGFKNAVAGADSAIVVTMPEVSSGRDADRIIGLLSSENIDDIKLLINRTRPDLIRRGDMLDIDDTLDILNVDLLGVVPDDESIIRATNLGEPAVTVSSSKAGEAYRRIVVNLVEGRKVDAREFKTRGFRALRKMFAVR